MNDNISLFRVGKSLDRTKNTLTLIGSVARIDVNVKRAKTEGTVISRGVAKRQDLFSAVFADKSRIVFLKSLVFHNTTYNSAFKYYFPTQNFENMSETISSLTARPSSWEIAPRARSISVEAASWEKPS